jgi:hypothetical protein
MVRPVLVVQTVVEIGKWEGELMLGLAGLEPGTFPSPLSRPIRLGAIKRSRPIQLLAHSILQDL